MTFSTDYTVWLAILLIVRLTSGLSFNQPKFSPYASWNPDATTFANSSTIGSNPYSVFVDINNTVYVADQTNNLVQVWLEGSNNPTRTISGGFNGSCGLFVTINGDVYVDNGGYNYRVDKWTLNATNSVPVMNVTGSCHGLFVDINNTLYCSIFGLHLVVKMSLNDSSDTVTIAAGNGYFGNASNMFYGPSGIFVDINFNLYVADSVNNRVQLFPPGQLNGTTVAGSTAVVSFELNGPIGVVLDGDGYLFIVDYYNQRIIGSGPNGFRCVVGCSGTSGSASNQLYNPRRLSFDSYGNMFVTDAGNSRIQQFILATNSCGECC